MYGGLATTTSTWPSNSVNESAMSASTTTAPVPVRLPRNQPTAVASTSTAKSRTPGTSSTSAALIAPEPAHSSTTKGEVVERAASMAAPATSSVSGRGTKTPAPTASATLRNQTRPVRCCTGVPAQRSATNCS